MKEMVCIECPNSCMLHVEESSGTWQVSGNKCRRGIDFAIREQTQPLRTISSTVRTVFPHAPVVPVKVSKEIPKDRIFDVMKEINAVVIRHPMQYKDVVLAQVCGLDVDIVLTSNLIKGERGNE